MKLIEIPKLKSIINDGNIYKKFEDFYNNIVYFETRFSKIDYLRNLNEYYI